MLPGGFIALLTPHLPRRKDQPCDSTNANRRFDNRCGECRQGTRRGNHAIRPADGNTGAQLIAETLGYFGKIVQQIVIDRAAQLAAQTKITFPLRLVEKLIGRRLFGERRIARFVAHQIKRQRPDHGRLDDQQVADLAGRVLDTRHHQKRCAIGQRDVSERAKYRYVQVGNCGGCAVGLLKNDLGVEVDARQPNQIVHVIECVARIRTAISNDDDVDLALEQCVNTGVFEMTPITDIPVRLVGAGEGGEHFIEQVSVFGQGLPKQGRVFQRLAVGACHIEPISEPNAAQRQQRGQPVRGTCAHAGGRSRTRYRDPLPKCWRNTIAVFEHRAMCRRADIAADAAERHIAALAITVELTGAVIDGLVDAHVD